MVTAGKGFALHITDPTDIPHVSTSPASSNP